MKVHIYTMCHVQQVELIEEDQDIDDISSSFFFFIKNNGFPVTFLHWDRKSKTCNQTHGAGIKAVHYVKKDDIIEEASALFGVRQQVLAFKDGREVPDHPHEGEKDCLFVQG